ncbi:shikimate dehydrogenase [Acidianus sulfidivorans JP7]|uniref:Shikimate dehydrogenase (NADP(+)) n=1 Tax=Acidianus sulfidivorans JP7 TaxID=619593 RepID=A0A2U9INQ3_9CREN|nr:shikimate dehydrogenase [Acidianus sulfidivorans]AWR97645.1 shikimate dehydrogenase [Acidianus sulfidivorans JP7]
MLIDYNTKLYGIIGNNISYTLSPAIHNFSFEKMQINAVYLAFDINQEKFERVIRGLLEIGEGFNVTIPYKEKIIHNLDDVDNISEMLGAVNTVYKLRGYNTDYKALVTLIKEKLGKESIESAVIFGAGGAAKAAAFALASYGSEIFIINRSLDRANKLVENLNKNKYKAKVIQSCNGIEYDVIVNATPNPLYIDKECIKGKLAIDFVYHPIITEFLDNSIKKGLKVINGLEILIYQALEAQKIWFGKSLSYEEVVNYLYGRKLIG